MPYMRSPLIVIGLLLFVVGAGDLVAGRTKVAQYAAELATARDTAVNPKRPLFPTATEGSERRQVAAAKLGFYQLLVLVGQSLVALGVGLATWGIVRVRLYGNRPQPMTPQHN